MIRSHPFETQLPEITPSLRRRAMKLTSNAHRAEDLVQATLLKAWANRDRYAQETNLRAWLFTILRNTFYSSLRKTRREVQDTDGVHAATLSERPAHDSRLAFKDFQRAFDVLSPEHREVLILVGASGFSCEEASRMMGVAVGTVKSRASRARKRLAELLHLQDGEDMFSGTDGATQAVVLRNSADAF